jgi:hypothetical protein
MQSIVPFVEVMSAPDSICFNHEDVSLAKRRAASSFFRFNAR